MFPIPLYTSIFYISIWYHIPEGFPLVFVVVYLFWWWVLSVVVCLKKNHYFTFIFKRKTNRYGGRDWYLFLWVLALFPVKNLQSSLFYFSVMYQVCCLQMLYGFLLLVLKNLIMRYLHIFLFMFLVFRVHWASWTCGFIVFIKFGQFSAIISSNICLSSPAWLKLLVY